MSTTRGPRAARIPRSSSSTPSLKAYRSLGSPTTARPR
jgi:hypothetical protein